MNNIKSVESITLQELHAGIYGGLTKGSWHETYKESAWVFLGECDFPPLVLIGKNAQDEDYHLSQIETNNHYQLSLIN